MTLILTATQTRVPHFSRPLREVGILTSCPKKRRGCPILARSLRKGGTHKRPQQLAFDLDVVFDLARVERTLLSVAFDFEGSYQGMPSGIPQTATTVERAALQRRVSNALGGAALR